MEAVKKISSSKRSRSEREPHLSNAEAGPKKRPLEKELALCASARSRHAEGKSSKDEIDDIFAQKKRKDEEQRQVVIPDENTGPTLAQAKKKQRRKDEKMGSKGKDGRPKDTSDGGKAKRKTVDGLSIYGADELKWNTKNAGGTPLCPFDCACCF